MSTGRYLARLALRNARNSLGPFSKRRFRLIRSSDGADLSANESISRAAIRNALAVWLRCPAEISGRFFFVERRFLVVGFYMLG